MVTARSIIVADAACSLSLRHRLYWEARGAFQGRNLTVGGHKSEEEAIQAWQRLAESIDTATD
jgi:hypothetical protein